jgi:hypothetical protein
MNDKMPRRDCKNSCCRLPLLSGCPADFRDALFSVRVPFNSFQKSDVILIKYDVQFFAPFLPIAI